MPKPRPPARKNGAPSPQVQAAFETATPADTPAAAAPGERIAKALARAGVCSRRDAERWIAEGRVSVNGRILDTPAVKVGPKDRIVVDGMPVEAPEATRVWRYHKPTGLVTSHRDPQGRPTVFEHLPEGLPRVISVGRLDLNSEGLLLLTNDGELARTLELPATGWLRRYRVRAFGRVTQEELSQLRAGIEVDGETFGPIDAVLEKDDTANAWIAVSLREGRNREVRRVLDAIGLKVNRLIRVSYGPFQLGRLAPGEAEEVSGAALEDMVAGLMPATPVRGQRAQPKLAAARSAPRGAAPSRSPKPAPEPAAAKGPARTRKAPKRLSLLDEEDAIRRDRRGGKPGGGPGGSGGSGGRSGPQARGARPGPNRNQSSRKPAKPRP